LDPSESSTILVPHKCPRDRFCSLLAQIFKTKPDPLEFFAFSKGNFSAYTWEAWAPPMLFFGLVPVCGIEGKRAVVDIFRQGGHFDGTVFVALTGETKASDLVREMKIVGKWALHKRDGLRLVEISDPIAPGDVMQVDLVLTILADDHDDSWHLVQIHVVDAVDYDPQKVLTSVPVLVAVKPEQTFAEFKESVRQALGFDVSQRVFRFEQSRPFAIITVDDETDLYERVSCAIKGRFKRSDGYCRLVVNVLKSR
jgi:hypothetical protein